MSTNLLKLQKISVKINFLKDDHSSASRDHFRQKVVKKGIYKFAPKQLAETAINGFRRSLTTPQAVEEDFLKSDQPHHPVVRDYHYHRALRVVEKLFRPSRRLKPISFPDLRYYPWSLSVSAEYPYTTEPRWRDLLREKQRDGEIEDGACSFHNLYNEIFDNNRKLVHRIKNGETPFWNEDREPQPYGFINLHSRSHLAKQDKPDKIRAVFGVPKLLLMVENMFIWNLQKEYLNGKVDSPMLWGFETSRGGWQKLRNKLSSSRFASIISADWGGFDHRALHEIIDDTHNMWHSWFDFDDGYEPTNFYPHSNTGTFDSQRIENLWHWMTEMVKHYPIRLESGDTYQWQHNGIASGFQQTQLLDSFVNAIMLLTVLSASGINIESPDFRIKVQGDDGLVLLAEPVYATQKDTFLPKLSQEADTRFNAELSDTKTTFSDNFNHIEVLSYGNINGIATRDEAELLAHLLYPERPQGLKECAAACIGIAYAAMGSSKVVYDICRDIHSHIVHDLKIEPSLAGIRQYERAGLLDIRSIERFPSFLETFHQNFDLTWRSEKDKQRLWPSKPTQSSAFHFLLD